MSVPKHTPLEVIAASKGTRLITSGAKTGLNFRGFQVNEDAVVSVLTSQAFNESTGDYNDAADVLTSHIEDGSSTTLKSGTLVICQQHHFVNITVDSGSINLIL